MPTAGSQITSSGFGCDQLHHRRDDVARRAELAVLAGGGDLRQHVLVDVALGVAVAHVELVELVDDLGEQRRARDLEAGIAHVARIGRAVAVERAEEREDVLVDDAEHLARLEMLEARPAQVLVGLAALVLALREDAPLHRLAERGGLALLQLLHLVEALDEDQVGDLLDHLERIGEPARPEVVPDAVDLVAQFTRQHSRLASVCGRSSVVGRLLSEGSPASTPDVTAINKTV